MGVESWKKKPDGTRQETFVFGNATYLPTRTQRIKSIWINCIPVWFEKGDNGFLLNNFLGHYTFHYHISLFLVRIKTHIRQNLLILRLLLWYDSIESSSNPYATSLGKNVQKRVLNKLQVVDIFIFDLERSTIYNT